MTTDITELAQLRAELSNPAVGSKDHLRKLALSLVEALDTKDADAEWMRRRIAELAKERETKEEQRANWFQMAQKLGEDLDAAEKRIAELESKLANPVQLPKTNGYWTEPEKAYEEAITLAKRQVRLAGFRCDGDE